MDQEFEVSTDDCQRWAKDLRAQVDADPRETEENRVRILCAYLLYCFADTIRDELPGGALVSSADPNKELN